MSSPRESIPPLDQKAAILEELRRGREAAALLGLKLHDTEFCSLADQVIGNFSRSLSLVTTADFVLTDSPKSDQLGIPRVRSAGGLRRRIPATPCKEVTKRNPSDGYKWRKYGQKDIKGFNYPRVYYYCYHREQGCKVSKHVQIKDDDPSLFVITYFGNHTCTAAVHSSLKEKSPIGIDPSDSNHDAHQLSASYPPSQVLAPGGDPLSDYAMAMLNLELNEGSMLGAQNVGTFSDNSDLIIGTFEDGYTSGVQTAGSLSDHGDVAPGLKASFSMDSSDIDEGALLKDNDEMFSFDW